MMVDDVVPSLGAGDDRHNVVLKELFLLARDLFSPTMALVASDRRVLVGNCNGASCIPKAQQL